MARANRVRPLTERTALDGQRDAYAWYRYERAYKWRLMGLSLGFIAEQMDVSIERVRQMIECWATDESRYG